MNRTDIVLSDGTLIPDRNATDHHAADPAPADPAPVKAAVPARLQVALITSWALLICGSAYRLGDVLDPGQPYLPALAPWAWPAAQAGAIGLVASGLIWAFWRASRRSRRG